MKQVISPVLAGVIIGLAGCGGGEDVQPLVKLDIFPSSNADLGSSYSNARTDLHIGYSSLPFQSLEGLTPLTDAIAYLDADGDFDTDVFLATGSYLLEGEVPSQMFVNEGGGVFTLNNDDLFSVSPPPATHARKSIVVDLNKDGLKDIFVFDHGYDAQPFPGSTTKQVMQDVKGEFSWEKLSRTGFFHGGSGADIDNDGDIDIFVGGFSPFFYINDGEGNLSAMNNRFDGSIDKVFSVELIDVDEDGYVDLIVGAHEQDGDATRIYWGNSTGAYGKARETRIPAVTGYGVVLDFDAEDVNGDGRRDLVVTRTGSDPFYQGLRVQLLLQSADREFDDGSDQIDDAGQDYDTWFPWMRMQDIDRDGDIDIFSDDKDDDFLLTNDGQGNFTRSGFSI